MVALLHSGGTSVRQWKVSAFRQPRRVVVTFASSSRHGTGPYRLCRQKMLCHSAAEARIISSTFSNLGILDTKALQRVLLDFRFF